MHTIQFYNISHSIVNGLRFPASRAIYGLRDKILTFIMIIKVHTIELFKGLEIIYEKHTGHVVVAQYMKKKKIRGP